MSQHKPLPAERIREIRKEWGNHKHCKELIAEIKRLKRAYVGEELNCLSPIAERTGRKIKILVNRLNADAAINAVVEGVRELAEEVDKWNLVSIEELNIPLFYQQHLIEVGITTVGELITQTDKDLQGKIPAFGDDEVYRIGVALRAKGIQK